MNVQQIIRKDVNTNTDYVLFNSFSLLGKMIMVIVILQLIVRHVKINAPELVILLDMFKIQHNYHFHVKNQIWTIVQIKIIYIYVVSQLLFALIMDG